MPATLPGFNHQMLSRTLLRSPFPRRHGKWLASRWLEPLRVGEPTKSNTCLTETPLRQLILSCLSQAPLIASSSLERRLILVAAELLALALPLFYKPGSSHEEYPP